MKSRLDTLLFPENKRLLLTVVCLLACLLSFLLIGEQIWAANWWIIDDHEIFYFLGHRDHLRASDLLNTLLTKTEVGTWDGRFRPGYYFLRVVETCLWGRNVHLWYLARTICFAVFIASVWWLLIGLTRLWLGTALLLPILTLPFWSDVWARLGPAEIYGAFGLGLMISGIIGLETPERAWQRNVSAAMITLGTIILIGSKETFLPIAAAGLAALVFAAARKRISILVAAVGLTIACAFGLVVVGIVWKITAATGTDIYANKIDPGRQLLVAAYQSARDFRTPLLWYAGAIACFGVVTKLQKRPIAEWRQPTLCALVGFVFLAGVLASQYLAYRTSFPTATRYDFPAMLLRPAAFALLAWYVLQQCGLILSARISSYISLAAAICLVGWYVPTLRAYGSSQFPRAVAENVERTNRFFPTVQTIVASAQQHDQRPIILEAYGSGAYEPMFSMQIYLSALDARNPISVRLHPDASSSGPLYDELATRIRNFQDNGNGNFVALSKTLDMTEGCISVGLGGAPSQTCSIGYQIQW
jgi:hypothetical protein